MSIIFSVTNQKGGVGKTTSVMNIGAYLAVKGNKVLLVDIDPQSNLTSGMGIKNDGKIITSYELILGKESIENAIIPGRIEGLNIVPSSIDLAGAEIELVNIISRETVLKKMLDEISKNYDYVLIDCPPSLGLLTINGLVASNKVLIPVQSEYFALEGLGQLLNTINLVKENLNSDLDIGGVILTMFDSRTNLSKDVSNEIKSHFTDKIFNSVIPRSVRLSEAPSYGLSIYEYAPQSAGAFAYESLTMEIMKRFDSSWSKLKRPVLNKDVESQSNL